MDESNEPFVSNEIPGPPEVEPASFAQTVIHAHYFNASGSHWYVAEYHQRTRMFFGYAIIAGLNDLGSWGDTSVRQLEALWARGAGRDEIEPELRIERDLEWTPRPFAEVTR